MNCPKCKAKIGLMKHQIIVDFGVARGVRCIICGYWSQPDLPHKHKLPPAPNETTR